MYKKAYLLLKIINFHISYSIVCDRITNIDCWIIYWFDFFVWNCWQIVHILIIIIYKIANIYIMIIYRIVDN